MGRRAGQQREPGWRAETQSCGLSVQAKSILGPATQVTRKGALPRDEFGYIPPWVALTPRCCSTSGALSKRAGMLTG
jgi:hypothetical protein